MSTDQAVNSETIEQTKQQIRGLVSEIAQLSKSDLGADEYYAAFLQRIISALAAVGGAIWVVRDGRRLELAYHIKMDEQLLAPESEDAAKHFALLSQVAGAGEPALIPPHSAAADERAGGNPTDYLLVLSPLKSSSQVEGVVEIFQRPDAQPVTQRGYLKFLIQMSELASEWFKGRQLRQISDRHSLWEQADHFARLVHQDLDVRETAYTIVNEGRRVIGCDRVSIGLMRGRICKIEAVSGQDTIENRSNIVNYLGKLATRVLATGESLWFDGADEDLPPQVEEALDDYIDESHTKTLAILPLRRPKRSDATRETVTGEADEESNEANEIIGAMIVEQIESDLPEEVLRSHSDLIYEHSARALTNAVDHNRVFLMPVWKTLGKSRWLTSAKNLPKTVAALIGLFGVLLALLIIPADFQPKSDGALQPTQKRDVFVAVDGRVLDFFVHDKDVVKKDQLLVQLVNTDLDVQVEDVTGQILAKESVCRSKMRTLHDEDNSLKKVDAIRLRGEVEEQQQQLETLKAELVLLSEKKEMLAIKSPIDGEVMMSWDVQRSLQGRPVTAGQVLMSVADPSSDWELELYMRESRSGHVTRARGDADLQAKYPGVGERVLYVLATDPGNEREGTIREVKGSTELHDQESIVKMKVDINRDDIGNPHPGATVTAKVYCGRKPLGYVWFHEAWEWFQGNILFYLS